MNPDSPKEFTILQATYQDGHSKTVLVLTASYEFDKYLPKDYFLIRGLVEAKAVGKVTMTGDTSVLDDQYTSD